VLLGLFAVVALIAGGAFFLLDDGGIAGSLEDNSSGAMTLTDDGGNGPSTEVSAVKSADPDRTKLAVPASAIRAAAGHLVAAIDPGSPVGALAGRAIDTDGLPVADAAVRLYKGSALTNVSLARVELPNFTMTDSKGQFVLENIPVDRNYVVVGEHIDYALAEHTGIVVREGKLTSGVRLLFGPGATIGGLVTSLAENPIGEARVELYDTVADARLKPADRRPWKIVFTDPYGRFAFEHVSTISIKVRVEAPGFESQTHMLSSALQAGPTDQTLTFRLANGMELNGRAVDDFGRGIANVRVEANALKREYQGNSIAFSDDKGHFLLEGLSTEYPYQLRAEADGYSTKTVPQVRVADGTVLIEMQSRGAVNGWVTNSNGHPVTDFAIALMRARPGTEPQLMADLRHFTDSSGEFVFDNLEPGSYAFEARSPDYAPSRSEAVTVSRGQNQMSEVRITMLKGGTLKGLVLGSDGKPVHRALVSVNANNFVDTPILKIFAALAPSAEVVVRARTNAKGRFQIKHVMPGTYQVAVKHSSAAQLIENDVVIIEDQTLELELRLPVGAAINGRALNENRQPLAFTQVQINQKTGFADSVTTDKNGLFGFENLREGLYSLSVNPERLNDKPVAPLVRLVYATKSRREVSLREGQTLDGIDLYVQQQ
jgi:protocatechuate 3,4-dioxygenase beta subunit